MSRACGIDGLCRESVDLTVQEKKHRNEPVVFKAAETKLIRTPVQKEFNIFRLVAEALIPQGDYIVSVFFDINNSFHDINKPFI